MKIKRLNDLDELKRLLQEKEKEILRVRGDYFRLVEQFKAQIKDRQVLVESLTNEDAKNMKLMLQLQNKIQEAEKNADRALHEAQLEKDTEVGKIKKAGQEKLKDGDVKIEEKKDENKSLKEVFRKMGIYECQLLEWNAQCVTLQEKINKVKYDNQIKMAEDRQRIEAQHENSIEEFK